jgi:hypothetical protein
MGHRNSRAARRIGRPSRPQRMTAVRSHLDRRLISSWMTARRSRRLASNHIRMITPAIARDHPGIDFAAQSIRGWGRSSIRSQGRAPSILDDSVHRRYSRLPGAFEASGDLLQRYEEPRAARVTRNHPAPRSDRVGRRRHRAAAGRPEADPRVRDLQRVSGARANPRTPRIGRDGPHRTRPTRTVGFGRSRCPGIGRIGIGLAGRAGRSIRLEGGDPPGRCEANGREDRTHPAHDGAILSRPLMARGRRNPIPDSSGEQPDEPFRACRRGSHGRSFDPGRVASAWSRPPRAGP